MGLLSISGLISGLDTAALVDSLMELERQPVVRMQSEQILLQVRKEAWQAVNTALYGLHSASRSLRESSLYGQFAAHSSDESVVAVSVSATAGAGTYALNVTSLAKAHIVAGDYVGDIVAGADINTPLNLDGILTIKVGAAAGVDIAVGTGDSLRNIRDNINAAAGIGAEASIIDNRLVLTGQTTGMDAEITITSTDAVGGADNNALGQALGFLNAVGVLKNVLQTPTDAEFDLNGLQGITRSTNTISDVVEGVTFELKKVGVATVTVSPDHDRVVNAVNDFIAGYNAARQLMQQKTAIDVDGASGILHGDSSVNRILTTMRRIAGDRVACIPPGQYDSLSAIGITTVEWGAAEPDGTLILDEARLREVLASDPAAVENLFRLDGGGVARRMEDYLWSVVRTGGLIDGQEQGTERQVTRLERRIENMERRIEQRGMMLRRQFLAMERVLGQMTTQSDWLTQQMRLLPGVGDGSD